MSGDLTVDQKVRPPQAHRARVTDGGRTLLSIPKVAAFLDALVAGEDFRAASTGAGLRFNRARRLFSDPAIRREFHKRVDALVDGERARNLLLQKTIRDRGLKDDATAAQQKVSLEATRQLQPADQSSITINGGQNVIAGYVIDLRGEAEGPRRIAPQGSVSREAEDVG